MRTSLVLAVLGADRPGLIEAISAIVASHKGNWLESQFARLEGQFAGLLHVDVQPEQTDALIEALGGLGSEGLHVHSHRAVVADKSSDDHAMHLELLGHDRPGIVHEVAAALAQRAVNVVGLHTECVSAPMTGEPLFKVVADLTAPASLPLSELHDTLEQIAEQLQLDLHLDS